MLAYSVMGSKPGTFYPRYDSSYLECYDPISDNALTFIDFSVFRMVVVVVVVVVAVVLCQLTQLKLGSTNPKRLPIG